MQGLEYTTINLAIGGILATVLGYAIGLGHAAILLGCCFGFLMAAIGFVADSISALNQQIYNQRRGK